MSSTSNSDDRIPSEALDRIPDNSISDVYTGSSSQSSRLFWLFFISLVFVGAARGMMLGGAAVAEADPSNRIGLETGSTSGLAFLISLIPTGLAILLIAYNGVYCKRTVVAGGPVIALWLTLAVYWGFQCARSIIAEPYAITNAKLGLSILNVIAVYSAYRAGITYKAIYSTLRFCVWSWCVGMLVLLIVAPHLVVTSFGGGLWRGVPFRLHGFAHSNETAFFLGFYLLMPRSCESSRSPLSRLLDAMCWIGIFLAQSKAVIGLLAFGFALKMAAKVYLSQGASGRRAVILGGVLALVLMFAARDQVLDFVVSEVSTATSISAESLESMTGRKVIWEQMLRDWEQRPWFGYGISTWHSLGIGTVGAGNFVATHGHNQLIQTLWEGGTVGAVLLVVHAMSLLYCSCRVDLPMRAGLFAAMVFFLSRGYTEIVLSVTKNRPSLYIYLLLLLCVSVLATSADGTDQDDEMPEHA